MPPDGLGRLPHLGKVGGTIGQGGGAHGEEDHLRLGNGLPVSVGEGHPAPHRLQHLPQVGLVEGQVAPVEPPHLVRVQVHPHHLVAHVGQAQGRGKAYVSRTYHRDLHTPSSLSILSTFLRSSTRSLRAIRVVFPSRTMSRSSRPMVTITSSPWA